MTRVLVLRIRHGAALKGEKTMPVKKRCFTCERVLGGALIEAHGQVFCLTCEGRVSGLIRRHRVVEALKSALRYIWDGGEIAKVNDEIRDALASVGVDAKHV